MHAISASWLAPMRIVPLLRARLKMPEMAFSERHQPSTVQLVSLARVPELRINSRAG
jgi:hypothetical protein